MIIIHTHLDVSDAAITDLYSAQKSSCMRWENSFQLLGSCIYIASVQLCILVLLPTITTEPCWGHSMDLTMTHSLTSTDSCPHSTNWRNASHGVGPSEDVFLHGALKTRRQKACTIASCALGDGPLSLLR